MPSAEPSDNASQESNSRNGIPAIASQAGREVAAQLLCTIGDNPQRLASEVAFAMLCGVAPLPASSGKTQRHRLNRGGDRTAVLANGYCQVGAGGAIVLDSDPEAEYAEMLLKAQAVRP